MTSINTAGASIATATTSDAARMREQRRKGHGDEFILVPPTNAQAAAILGGGTAPVAVAKRITRTAAPEVTA